MKRGTYPGLNRVKRKHPDGSETVYFYAWKGGPKLIGAPGDPDFDAAYRIALKLRQHSDEPKNLAGLCIAFRESPEFLKLAESTQRNWSRWLNLIETHQIGTLPLAALNDAGVSSHFKRWRDQWVHSPRSADYAFQVLGRVLSVSKEGGLIKLNAVEGTKSRYRASRAELIWEAGHLVAFDAKAPKHLAQALRLAALTGLRRGDLVRLRWIDVKAEHIEVATRKSRGERTAIVPLLPETLALLDEIGRGDPLTLVLRNAKGLAWDESSLTHRVAHYATTIGVERSLHDARGTFATRLAIAGLATQQIAMVMGWEEGKVERIMSKYVDRERIVRSIVSQMREKVGNAN